MTPQNPKAPAPEEMQQVLSEIEQRIGVDGAIANDPSWDYRDIWLGRCVAYIRSLEARCAALEEDHRVMKNRLEIDANIFEEVTAMRLIDLIASAKLVRSLIRYLKCNP